MIHIVFHMLNPHNTIYLLSITQDFYNRSEHYKIMPIKFLQLIVKVNYLC